MKMNDLHDTEQEAVRAIFKASIAAIQAESGGFLAIAEGMIFSEDMQNRIIDAAINAVEQVTNITTGTLTIKEA